ncbi:MAG: peptide chain release factor N(5)-glutamine methyltransferase [Firmicutes bacterium]|nr:peptide chain release factor N(5)-glutamine methyltransferase [Bacillota bacterium]
MTIKELINLGEKLLRAADVQDAENDARELIGFVTGKDRSGLIMYLNSEVPEETMKRYLELVDRRASRVPLQQITGEAEFMGFRFKVTKDVLAPRLETELLVREAAQRAILGARILDLCTGSGIIGIALKKICFGCEVVMTDVSEEALEVAKENAEANKAEVKLIRSDMFEGLEGEAPFSMIVSNPPYIAAAEIGELEPEVKDHEPMAALDGGEDGLDFYRIIAAEAPAHLKPSGYLLLEIGYDQGETVPGLLEQTGAFRDVKVIKDLSGNDRVVIAQAN